MKHFKIAENINSYEYQITSTVKDVFNLFDEMREDKELVNFPLNSEQLKKGGYLNCLNEGKREKDFFGGMPEEFKASGEGNFPMELFYKQKEKMKSIRQELSDNLQPIGVIRKRKFHESDGDWIEERQWEIEPFSSTYRERGGLLPSLEINIDTSFSFINSAESIAEFSAFCWAVIDAVEENGINCEVNLQNTCSMQSQGKLSNKKTKVVINAKRAGEYIDIMNLARAFTPSFLRRGILPMKIAFGEQMGCKIYSGISAPEPETGDVYSPGKLYLSIKNKPRDMKYFAENIIKSLHGN